MSKFLKILIITTVLSFQNTSHAQKIISIKGNVINDKQEVLVGNALLISSLDSTVIKGTSFFEGKFELNNLNESNVLLKFTSLEFADTFITIDYKGNSNIDLGDIIIKEATNQLEEVVLVSNRPLFKTKSNGTLQVNVENTVLSTSNSVQEILSRSPNVLVEEENISVFGKGVAIIYLNGQRIFNDQLTNIQASEIKNIEIITNPSSKYDAEGQAVININTKTSSLDGIKGRLSQNISTSDFSPSNTNTNFSLDYRKQHISVRGNYSMRLGANRFLLNTHRNRSEEGDLFNSDITTDWEREQKYFANYGIGVQYNFTGKSYLSIGYNGLSHALGGTISSNNDIDFNGAIEQFQSVVNKDDLTIQNAFVLNYFKSLDTLGSSIYLGGQYSLYKTKLDDVIDEEAFSEGETENRTLKNYVDREIPILSTQLDYTKVFSEQSQLEAGIKFGSVTNTSDSNFLVSSNNNNFEIDDNLSRDFEYNEQVYAAYFNYKKKISEKVNSSFGLRSEQTKYNLKTDNLDEPIENGYFNLFPNASLGIALNENQSIFASYVSSILRPRYQHLNPSIIFQDTFSSIQGNPNLVPEKIHAFEIGTTIRKLTLKLGYNFTVDPIIAAAFLGDNPKSYVLKRLNSDKRHEVFANIILPINTNWWKSMNTLTFSYNKLIDNQLPFSFNKTEPKAYLYTNNKFTLYKDFKLQLIAFYLSNRSDGIYSRKNKSEITLGLEKNFFDKSIKLQLVANDIFHTNKHAGAYSLGDTSMQFDWIHNTQYFRFVVTYNFGKLKKTNYQRKSSGKEENKRL